jgi:coenzyme F420-0:L-glutamate ligase / coenzyme F420-1:gamma-L-glutamate ligase
VAPVELSHQAAGKLQEARVARLATADGEGRPQVVPVCFVWSGGQVYVALDDKPKDVPPEQLKRVRNIGENPHASLLIDTYSEDWSKISYLMLSGQAGLEGPGTEEHGSAVRQLREKYLQYRSMRIDERPLIRITPARVHEWSGDGSEEAETREHLPFDALARGRHVVRRFLDREVPRALVERTLEAARWAPSPHGAQPWRFAVVTRPEMKARLAEEMAQNWQGTLMQDGEGAEVVERRLKTSQARILRTPVAIVPCLYLEDLDRYPDPARQEAERLMAVQSLGAAIQNMLLCAYSLGLDTGWMCAPLFAPEAVRGALSLPDTWTPHALIQMGYAAQDPPRKEKREISQLTLWLE